MEAKHLRFYTTLKMKANKEEDRTVDFIATKEIIDRDGEILKVSGLTTANYKKNPVVLWAHDRRGLPVGKTVKISKRGDIMKMRVQFAKPEEYGFADTVYKLVKGGYLNAVSVGFTPDYSKTEYPGRNKPNSKIYRIFHKTDLLELSVCPIGVNQEALSVDKALQDGIIDEVELNEWNLYYEKAIEQYEDIIDNIDDTDTKKLSLDILTKMNQEIDQRLQEIREENKSYLDSIFESYKKDISSSDKESQTDEFTEDDTKEILTEMGFDEDEINDLLEEE